MRKALFAAACVTALGLGTSALAQDAGDIQNGIGANITGFNDSSTNVDATIEDSLNNNSDNSTNTTVEVNDTGNNNSDNSTNTTIEVDDSFNNNSNTRTSANNVVMGAAVGAVAINFAGPGPGGQSGDFLTGDVVIDTEGSFAGIQNGGANTGFASNAVLANSISANADISFGD